MGKKYAGNKVDVDVIVSGAPAFAVVSPLRHEEEEWFDRNFAADDPFVVSPNHRSGDPATPGATVAQAVVGAGSINSSAPGPMPSKRRRVAAVDGGKSVASVSVGNSISSERRNEVSQQSTASSQQPAVAT